MDRPLILICNDDGVDAPGIRTLADCVAGMGEVYVVAPDRPQSGMSSAMTVNAPLRIRQHGAYNGMNTYSVTGSPVDCVKLAMHHVLPRRPDIMLSGINHGSNSGNSAIYSGTMGAVFEACMVGIPAVGYSLLDHSMGADFSECLRFIKSVTGAVLRDGLPQDVCLNVNFPSKVRIEGLKVVRAARSHWSEEYRRYDDPHGKPFYWLTGRQVNEEPDSDGTDLYWLERNYATVVPCRPDQTDVRAISLIDGMLK